MPRPAPDVPAPDRLLVSVKEAAAMLGLSRNRTYELLDQGLLDGGYIGARRLVLLDSVHNFARSLPTTPAERSA